MAHSNVARAFTALLSCSALLNLATVSAVAAENQVPADVLRPQLERLIAGEKSYLNTLKPQLGGKGVAVGDAVCPEFAGSPPAGLQEFGDGCARWLNFELGNCGALNRTPSWPEITRTIRDTGMNWHFGAAQVSSVASHLDVTHLVLTTLRGKAEDARLSFQLVQASDGKGLGEPIVLTGDFQAIAASLPSVAPQMEALLGVHDAAPERLPEDVTIPPEALATPAGPPEIGLLALMGRVELERHKPLSTELQAALVAASDDPAVEVILLGHPDGSKNSYVPRLRRSTLSTMGAIGASPVAADPLNIALRGAYGGLYPHDRQLAAFDFHRAAAAKDWLAAQTAAESEVTIAPLAAEPWRDLGEAISSRGNAIRRGRTMDNMNQDEIAASTSFYPRWLAVEARAAATDGTNYAAWLDLSTAANFSGDTMAPAALEKARQLDPEEYKIYWTGLQFNQPKWGGQPGELLRWLELASATPARTQMMAEDLWATLPTAEGKEYRSRAMRARLLHIADNLQSAQLTSDAGVFGTSTELRAPLLSAWKAALAAPDNDASWRALATQAANLERDCKVSDTRMIYRGRPSLPEGKSKDNEAYAAITGFSEFAASQWTQVAPLDPDSWLALARAGLEAYTGSSDVWDAAMNSFALSKGEARALPVAFMLKNLSTSVPVEKNIYDQLNAILKDDTPLAEAVAPEWSKAASPFPSMVFSGFPPRFGRQPQAPSPADQLCERLSTEKTAPGNGDLQHRLASYWLRRGDNTKAETAFGVALNLLPDDADLRLDYARFLQRQKKSDEALQQFQVASRLRPHSAYLHNALAECLRLTKHLTEARIEYDKVLELLPFFTNGYFQRGYTLLTLRQDAAAHRDFETVLSLSANGDQNSPFLKMVRNVMASPPDEDDEARGRRAVITFASPSPLLNQGPTQLWALP